MREGVNLLGILFSRSGPTRLEFQLVAKSPIAAADKHSRNKIMAAHSSGEFGAAYRHLREPGEPGFISGNPRAGPARDAGQSISGSARPFVMSLSASDPIEGGKQSRNFLVQQIRWFSRREFQRGRKERYREALCGTCPIGADKRLARRSMTDRKGWQ